MSDKSDKNLTELDVKSAAEIDAAYKALNLPEVGDDDPDVKESGLEKTDAAKKTKKGKDKPIKRRKGAAADPEISKRISSEIVTSKRVTRNIRSKFLRKLLLVIMSVALLVTSTVYIMLLLIEDNSMRIYVGQTEAGKSLTLCSDASFSRPTAYLTVNGPRVMDNITYDWLFTRYGIDETDFGQSLEGNFSGENHIAQTFYLKNNGTGDVQYVTSIKLLGSFKGMEDAIRVLVVKNGDVNIYATLSVNGEPEPVSNNPELLTVPFYSDEFVMYNDANILAAGEIDKYTIILWIEGEDPECTNERLGGYVKMEMVFGALSVNQGG
ncbi:MAG TPA: hypothetical protein P5161_06560 [Eubacteriales bacterium]|nr:hypothetical protein [Clostridia bacterium]HRR90420.1 hypothetical protein [Eubacteriales bacterium]HRU84546.1 hypothetical protein [Eubacteriales bacterium]